MAHRDVHRSSLAVASLLAVAACSSDPWGSPIEAGTKTVYVAFRNALGSLSAAVSDTIVLQ